MFMHRKVQIMPKVIHGAAISRSTAEIHDEVNS